MGWFKLVVMGCRVLDEFCLELVEVGATSSVLGDGFADYTPGGEVRGGVKKTSHGGMKNQDMQTNASGSAVATKMFDAFGNVVGGSGSWSGPYGYGGDYGYQADVDTGWRLLGHRYYDSDTGRFLTRDPAKDGRNWYSYCANNPVSRVDPTGFAWHDPTWVAVDPNFKGTVIAFGDFKWQKGDGWRDTVIQPGYASDPRMDVDLIVILDENGIIIAIWWLPGKNDHISYDREQGGYYVDKNGKVSPRNGSGPAQDPDNMYGSGNPLLGAAGGLIGRGLKDKWKDWIEEAERTGFPKGFEPKPYPGSGVPNIC